MEYNFNGEVPRFKGIHKRTGEAVEGAGCYTDVHGHPYIIDEGDGDLPVYKAVKEILIDN